MARNRYQNKKESENRGMQKLLEILDKEPNRGDKTKDEYSLFGEKTEITSEKIDQTTLKS